MLRPAPQTAPTMHVSLAVAALLVEAARADETYTESEKALIDAALSARFGLTPCCSAELRIKAEAAQAKSSDLYNFTKIAKEMPAEEKSALIETLWRVVLSDGTRDPHEDALIRRICGLLYVSDPERAAARHRAVRS